MGKNNIQDDMMNRLPEVQELIQDMVAELRFRGCDENHKLIKQAHIANEWLRKTAGLLQPEYESIQTRQT